MNQENSTERDFYRFVLYLNGQIISQTEFPAYVYNQNVRYFVNIKELAPEFIKSLQGVLSSRDENLELTFNGYNLFKEYQKQLSINKKVVNAFPAPLNKLDRINEEEYVEGRYTNKGEQFKFILYINENHIIERNFYVKNYNPKSRFSADLVETIYDIVSDIKQHIKKNDDVYMWQNNKPQYALSLN